MSPNEASSDLDSRIASIVERTVGKLRDEMMHRMRDTESRLHAITDRAGGPGDAPAAPAAAPEAPATASTAAGGDSAALFDAVVAIDRGTSQQEVLAALLEGVGGFASRSALFLCRADGAQGWGSYGFEDLAGEIQDVVLSDRQGPLAVLAEGRGCVPLSAEDCRDLCAQIGTSPGSEGLLVPFVLRDRMAAALYLDRFADDPPLRRRHLQLLAYVGSQAVEGLALRQRSETPTLQVVSHEPAATGPERSEVAAAPPPPAAPPASEPVATETKLSEPSLSEPRITEPATAPAAPPAETTLEEVAEVAAPAGPAPATPDAPELETGDEEWELPALSLDEPESAAAAPPAGADERPTQPLEALSAPAAAAPAEAPPAESPTSGGALGVGDAQPQRSPELAPPADQPSTGASGETEVRPPTDVSGPGWAFTASRAAAESGDDAQHEEARRLARLLVTEIKLYNEEQVEEGRRGNDIYVRLREDIDRSRQIFNERVDEDIRQDADYFHEEMVRILAGGNAEALGI